MPFAMYDSITIPAIPRLASTSHDAVAGYVGGSWPTFAEVVRLYPAHNHLSIAINAAEDADCLDIESGDATPVQAPDWVRRQHGRGVRRPCLYANLSEMPQVEAALNAAGIPRTAYRLWVADWTYVAHLPAGYDACQWTDHALGRSLDESLCADDFFDINPPAPTPKPKPKRHPVKRIVKRVLRPVKKIHPKVGGSTLGAVVASVVTVVLKKSGVHVPLDDQKILISVTVLLFGYLTPARKSPLG